MLSLEKPKDPKGFVLQTIIGVDWGDFQHRMTQAGSLENFGLFYGRPMAKCNNKHFPLCKSKLLLQTLHT